MADSKVTGLSDISLGGQAVTIDDLLYLVNDALGTPASRKVTIVDFLTFLYTQRKVTLWDAEVIKQSDQDVASNTTVADDSELRFDMAAAQLYEWEAEIVYSSPVGGGTPDFKLAFNGPATLTGVKLLDANYLSTADANGAAQAGQSLTTTDAIGTATTPRRARYSGWAYSTVGGTGSAGFRMQWAQNTSGVNPTRVHAGSLIRYRKMVP